MASITMAASFLSSNSLGSQSPVTARRTLVVANAAAGGQKVKMNHDSEKESSNGRRDLMFAAVAAAACSVAGVAAAEEPKAGTPEAKKFYSPVCVTMPTARICHK
ncbi:photosystem II 5 kDa protein, chloroplastic [Ricinus communis]|uniref:Photosystem II 5 kDa protein, chloroplast, putative n=1 Tax=Ricinus communis TaxID=3988 RepID=B9RVP8_RICCO|nr:photosystem II 5 kDa protein, chloroplastic [Ricinus communis]EEF44624.1 Photosystem II 5 kDa protein, chloroplast precursor, putative [Ricinus communis]|eukprot:XP_002517817.1 photosystem II 5 kDa protein, chloroplastic [Ricinus communis]